MPMAMPNSAATMPPMNSAIGKETPVGRPDYSVNSAAPYAPTDMKPAWPSASCPR